jgi:hypothetical protein
MGVLSNTHGGTLSDARRQRELLAREKAEEMPCARTASVHGGSARIPWTRLVAMARRMLSLASTPGWCARFDAEEPYEEERTVMLVSWVLVEEPDATTSIVGVVQRQATEESPIAQLGLADEVAGFRGYTFTGLATKEFPTL